MATILLSLQSLLGEPNPASPLNVQAAQLWEKQVSEGRMSPRGTLHCNCAYMFNRQHYLPLQPLPALPPAD